MSVREIIRSKKNYSIIKFIIRVYHSTRGALDKLGMRRVKLLFTVIFKTSTRCDIDVLYASHNLCMTSKTPKPRWKYNSDFLKKIKNVRENSRESMGEFFNLYCTALATKNILGDMAIVGVHCGGDSLLIARTKKEDVTLHLFDMFEEGMPSSNSLYDRDRHGNELMEAGKYTSSFQHVKSLVSDYKNVNIYPGFFPKTAEIIKDKKFRWVHLDADLYQTTIDGLHFFSQRMSPGGIILSHDYWNLPAVKAACDEFVATEKAYSIIPMAGSHCCLIKIL